MYNEKDDKRQICAYSALFYVDKRKIGADKRHICDDKLNICAGNLTFYQRNYST